MNKCPNRTKKLFKFFTISDNHTFIITNAFVTLTNPHSIDLIRSCQACGQKTAMELSKDTLLECVKLYPNAFDPLLRDYLLTWIP